MSVPPAERELGDGDKVKVRQQIYDVVVKPVDMNTVWGHGMCARYGELPPSRGGFATQTAPSSFRASTAPASTARSPYSASRVIKGGGFWRRLV